VLQQMGFRSGLVTDSGSANHLGLETEMATGMETGSEMETEMETETWLDLVMAWGSARWYSTNLMQALRPLAIRIRLLEPGPVRTARGKVPGWRCLLEKAGTLRGIPKVRQRGWW